ncbi:KAP family P-loop NTPase fold protein [Pseudoalteromonas sp.]|uniref:KAP family P-loop NTPase fold protein n=1 Tax=Pseudoalteromonas sp. TaxID=53249 RepID=UPI00272BB042|nr:P-loop NTPase fold protein [Pseudoalteromonas sp.]
MDFNWSEPTTIDEHSVSADNLDRAKYAKYLTSLIKAKGGTSKDNLSNYVLNLDAEWGAGKTYFLKRWSDDLKGNHPVVYIDAWSIDYLDSPLMTVLSEIIEQLKQQTDKIDSDETTKKLNEVIKAAAPRIGSALMKRYLGFDFNIFDSSDTEDGLASGTNNDVDFSKAGEKVLEVFCKEVTDSKKSVKTLKSAIQQWVEYVVNNPVKEMRTITNSFPAFIFIDELDRCKPTYAVEMLEAIKHVFDIPGLVFIVATNTKQLSHTVKSVYGVDFNAEEYLSRFFDNKYYLRVNVTEDLLLNNFSTKSITATILQESGVILFPFIKFEKSAFLKLCTEIFNTLKVAPRQAIKILNRVELIISVVKKNTTIDLPLLVTLVALMEKNHEQYEALVDWIKTETSLIQMPEMNAKCQEAVSCLYKPVVEVEIDPKAGRSLYPRVGSAQIDYESSNNHIMFGSAGDKELVVRKEINLSNYIELVLESAAKSDDELSKKVFRAKEELANKVESAHNRFIQNSSNISSGERNTLINEINKARLNAMFYIFRNTMDLEYYQELVEMSANLD